MTATSPQKKGAAAVHPPRHPIEVSELGRRFNPYEILGVTKTATSTVVKRAYRKRALKLHPDKNPGEEQAIYAAMFNNLTLIYEALLDPATRQAIDDRIAASEREEETRQMQNAQQSRLREDLLMKERIWREKSAAKDEKDRIKAANQELLDALKARREKELLASRRTHTAAASLLGKRPRSPPRSRTVASSGSLDGIINSVWEELVHAAAVHDHGGGPQLFKMPHCTASLLAGLQHKTADEVIPQELTALTWKYLTRRVFIPTLSPTCLKTIETRLDRLVLQDKQSMDLVADSGVAYFKSEDDSKIFVLDKLGKMLHPRSLQGSGLMMQLAGIEPESAALYTFQWNSSKGVMELHVDSSDRSDEPECCWSADGLLQARPLFAACGRNIFVANCGLQGSNPVAAIDVKCSVGNGDDDPDKWIKILAPLPGELIRAISVHACKDTSRIICAMEHSIWVTDLCLTTLSHGAPIVWTKIGNLAEGERVSQLVGISDNVVVGLFTRSGGLRTLRSIDLVNGVFKDIMSMKEEQVSMFLTKDHIWMASMIDEGVPQFAVVDLEWI